MSGNRGPELVGVRPDQRVPPVRLMWSRMTMSVPGPERRIQPAGGVGQHHDPWRRARGTAAPAGRRAPGRCPRRGGSGPGASRRPGRRAGRAAAVRRDRGRRRRPAGQLARTGSRPGPRGRRRARRGRSPARCRPRARPTVRPRTAATSAARRAGWSTGGIGRGRIDGAIGRVGHAGLQERVQGEDGRGPQTSSARRKYRHRDADRVPSGVPRGRAVVRQPRDAGNEAPEATGGGHEGP